MKTDWTDTELLDALEANLQVDGPILLWIGAQFPPGNKARGLECGSRGMRQAIADAMLQWHRKHRRKQTEDSRNAR